MKDLKYFTVPETTQKFEINRRTMLMWVVDGKNKSIVTSEGQHSNKPLETNQLLKQNNFSKKLLRNPSREKRDF